MNETVKNLVQEVLTQCADTVSYEMSLCDSPLDLVEAVDNILDYYEPSNVEEFYKYDDFVRCQLISALMKMLNK